MTIPHFSGRSVLTLLAILAMASSAHAQEIAGSFDQLRVLVKPGDTLTITDDAGVETRGRLAELSPASLALLVDGRRQVVPAADISTIRHRRGDSLTNGAAWGFGIGAVLGLAGGIALEARYEDDSNGAIPFFAALIYGGIGAGIGAGLDALHKSPQVIYARSRTTTSPVIIAPMMGRRNGVSIAVRF